MFSLPHLLPPFPPLCDHELSYIHAHLHVTDNRNEKLERKKRRVVGVLVKILSEYRIMEVL